MHAGRKGGPMREKPSTADAPAEAVPQTTHALERRIIAFDGAFPGNPRRSGYGRSSSPRPGGSSKLLRAKPRPLRTTG